MAMGGLYRVEDERERDTGTTIAKEVGEVQIGVVREGWW